MQIDQIKSIKDSLMSLSFNFRPKGSHYIQKNQSGVLKDQHIIHQTYRKLPNEERKCLQP